MYRQVRRSRYWIQGRVASLQNLGRKVQLSKTRNERRVHAPFACRRQSTVDSIQPSKIRRLLSGNFPLRCILTQGCCSTCSVYSQVIVTHCGRHCLLLHFSEGSAVVRLQHQRSEMLSKLLVLEDAKVIFSRPYI